MITSTGWKILGLSLLLASACARGDTSRLDPPSANPPRDPAQTLVPRDESGVRPIHTDPSASLGAPVMPQSGQSALAPAQGHALEGRAGASGSLSLPESEARVGAQGAAAAHRADQPATARGGGPGAQGGMNTNALGASGANELDPHRTEVRTTSGLGSAGDAGGAIDPAQGNALGGQSGRAVRPGDGPGGASFSTGESNRRVGSQNAGVAREPVAPQPRR